MKMGRFYRNERRKRTTPMMEESNWMSARRRSSAALRTTYLDSERPNFLAMSDMSIFGANEIGLGRFLLLVFGIERNEISSEIALLGCWEFSLLSSKIKGGNAAGIEILRVHWRALKIKNADSLLGANWHTVIRELTANISVILSQLSISSPSFLFLHQR